jgi:hypothetical protein
VGCLHEYRRDVSGLDVALGVPQLDPDRVQDLLIVTVQVWLPRPQAVVVAMDQVQTGQRLVREQLGDLYPERQAGRRAAHPEIGAFPRFDLSELIGGENHFENGRFLCSFTLVWRHRCERVRWWFLDLHWSIVRRA